MSFIDASKFLSRASRNQGLVGTIIVKSCLGQWLLEIQQQLWQNPPYFTWSSLVKQPNFLLDFQNKPPLVSLMNYQRSGCAQFPRLSGKAGLCLSPFPLVNMVAGPPAPTLDYEVTGSEATDVSLADGKSGCCGGLVALTHSYRSSRGSAFSLPPTSLCFLRCTWWGPEWLPKADAQVFLKVVFRKPPQLSRWDLDRILSPIFSLPLQLGFCYSNHRFSCHLSLEYCSLLLMLAVLYVTYCRLLRSHLLIPRELKRACMFPHICF